MKCSTWKDFFLRMFVYIRDFISQSIINWALKWSIGNEFASDFRRSFLTIRPHQNNPPNESRLNEWNQWSGGCHFMQEIAYDVHFWWMPYTISIRWQVKESHISVTPESRTKANARNRMSSQRCVHVWEIANVCVCVFGLYFILIRNDERDTDKVFAAAVESTIFNNI